MARMIKDLASAGAHMVVDGCSDGVLASSAVAMIKKQTPNPENLIAGALQRTLAETCSLLGEGLAPLRQFADMCGAEPEGSLRTARALLHLRGLVCGRSVVSEDVAVEWPCWQPLATKLWNCSQRADWPADPQACTLLQGLSECYERVAAAACGGHSGAVLRVVVLRTLARVPPPLCPQLEHALPPARSAWDRVLLSLGLALLLNLLLVAAVLLACTWWRRRRGRAGKGPEGEVD